MANDNESTVTVNFQQLVTAIHACIDARRAPLVEGPPGGGKSAAFKEAAAQRGLTLIDLRLNLYDPTDVRGMPMVVTTPDGHSYTQYATADWAREISGPTLVLADEIGQAQHATQNVFGQMVLDHALGTVRFPDDVWFAAATNRATDRAGVSRMLTQLANRLIHYTLAVDHELWCAWGANAKPNPVHWLVNAFVRFRPDQLHQFDRDAKQFPSPRAWHALSDLLYTNLPPSIEYATYVGTVGEGPATEFHAFAKIARSLPDLDDIIRNPRTAPVPTHEMAALYAICSGLARKATTKTFGNIIEYLDRVPQEFAVFAIRDCDDSLKRTKTFADWAIAHKDVLA